MQDFVISLSLILFLVIFSDFWGYERSQWKYIVTLFYNIKEQNRFLYTDSHGSIFRNLRNGSLLHKYSKLIIHVVNDGFYIEIKSCFKTFRPILVPFHNVVMNKSKYIDEVFSDEYIVSFQNKNIFAFYLHEYSTAEINDVLEKLNMQVGRK